METFILKNYALGKSFFVYSSIKALPSFLFSILPIANLAISDSKRRIFRIKISIRR